MGCLEIPSIGADAIIRNVDNDKWMCTIATRLVIDEQHSWFLFKQLLRLSANMLHLTLLLCAAISPDTYKILLLRAT